MVHADYALTMTTNMQLQKGAKQENLLLAILVKILVLNFKNVVVSLYFVFCCIYAK